MTNPLIEEIKKLVPLSEEEIEKLIEENKEKISIILYEVYSKDIISTMSWARGLKFRLDDCRLSEEDTVQREISVYETCQKKFAETGETEKADKYMDIILTLSHTSFRVTEEID